MKEQWQELKETIIELRDNDGTGTQQEVCKFLVNYMGVLEKQMVEQEPTVTTNNNEPMTIIYPTIVCDDAISREAVLTIAGTHTLTVDETVKAIKNLPSVTQKSGKCKNCKYFEYDSVAKVDGIPLIVAHEICNKWGDGCKTSENGYCYLYEPQESEE